MRFRTTFMLILAAIAMGMTSCEPLERLLSLMDDGGEAIGVRKKGLNYVKASDPDEVRRWRNEPNVLVITDYVENGCGTCDDVTASLGSLARKYGDRVAVLKIDVTESKELMRFAKSRGIRHFPSLEMHLNGEKLDLILGRLADSALEDIMEQYLEQIPENLVVREGFKKEILKPIPVGELPPGVQRVKIPENRPTLNDRLPTSIIKSPKDALPRR